MRYLFFPIISVICMSCCFYKADCNPPFSNEQKIEIYGVEIKKILEAKMYFYEKNSNFKTPLDTVKFEFNSMSGSSGMWIVLFQPSKYFDIYNYDWLIQADNKDYKITNIDFTTKEPKCGCGYVVLKSFLRNGTKYNQNIITVGI